MQQESYSESNPYGAAIKMHLLTIKNLDFSYNSSPLLQNITLNLKKENQSASWAVTEQEKPHFST